MQRIALFHDLTLRMIMWKYSKAGSCPPHQLIFVTGNLPGNDMKYTYLLCIDKYRIVPIRSAQR